jgi:hypothetical protein
MDEPPDIRKKRFFRFNNLLQVFKIFFLPSITGSKVAARISVQPESEKSNDGLTRVSGDGAGNGVGNAEGGHEAGHDHAMSTEGAPPLLICARVTFIFFRLRI